MRSLVQGLIEIQQLIAEHRPGGEDGRIEGFVRRGLADGKERGGISGYFLVVREQTASARIEQSDFRATERAGENPTGGEVERPFSFSASLDESPFGEATSRFDELWVVQGHESLERGIGAVASHTTDLSIRSIEDLETHRRGHSFPVVVYRAPIEIFALVLLVSGVAHADDFPHVLGLIGSCTGPPHLRGEGAAGGESRIADQFGVEPEARAAAEEAIVGILSGFFGVCQGRLAVGRGKQNGL